MPELTEVEVVRRELAKLRGGTIRRVVSDDARVYVDDASPVGRAVRDVGRRGKWLRLTLDEGRVFSHLGMTGDWTLRAPDDPPLPFERVRVDVEREFRGTSRVVSARYTDPRRFGRFITAKDDIDAWRELGPDPLLDGIDEARLLSITAKRRRAIKDVLLDQSVLAGVGNILATEGLWNAKIDPRTRADALGPLDIHALAKGLHAIIARTLAYNESMVATRGHAKEPFRVYGHAKEPCPRCRTALVYVVLGGRGTTYCPGCQERSSTG